MDTTVHHYEGSSRVNDMYTKHMQQETKESHSI